MIAALQTYNGGTRISAEEVPATGSETSESNPVLPQEFSDKNHSPQAPEGYTRGMQDPNHRGTMLRSPLKPSWLVAEMDGLYRRKCWVKVLRSSLTPQDKVFSTRFHYKIKRRRTVRKVQSSFDDSAIAAMESWSWRHIALIFGEASSRGTAHSDVSLNFTTRLSVHGSSE